MCKSFIGTVSFMAPEVVNGCDYDGKRADIWSMGLLIDEVFHSGKPFFDGKSVNLVMKKVLTKEYYVRSESKFNS